MTAALRPTTFRLVNPPTPAEFDALMAGAGIAALRHLLEAAYEAAGLPGDRRATPNAADVITQPTTLEALRTRGMIADPPQGQLTQEVSHDSGDAAVGTGARDARFDGAGGSEGAADVALPASGEQEAA